MKEAEKNEGGGVWGPVVLAVVGSHEILSEREEYRIPRLVSLLKLSCKAGARQSCFFMKRFHQHQIAVPSYTLLQPLFQHGTLQDLLPIMQHLGIHFP